jgi:ABC-type bacteriocin/lantibiotic exporter with double-glycine peptidase domain
MTSKFLTSFPTSNRYPPLNLQDRAEHPASLTAAVIGQSAPQLHARLAAAMTVARHHGVDPDPHAIRLEAPAVTPSSPALVEWLRQSGLWARGMRLSFRQLMKIDSPAPILLLLTDGGAALVVGRNREQDVLLIRDPSALATEHALPVGELRLKQVWDGATLLVRASRDAGKEEEPFDLGLLTRLVWGEKSILRDVGSARSPSPF